MKWIIPSAHEKTGDYTTPTNSNILNLQKIDRLRSTFCPLHPDHRHVGLFQKISRVHRADGGDVGSIYRKKDGSLVDVDEETHRILQLNPFLKNWLGYQEEELRGMTLEDLRAADGGDVGSIYRKKDGSLVDVEETRTQVPFQGRQALLIVAHDVSDHKQMEAMLQDLSRRDGLTGLANRRHFDECLDREWKRALREKAPLSIIMCDIDFFENFNDTYGHQIGDECLRAVARVL
jgi:hypothetical protein